MTKVGEKISLSIAHFHEVIFQSSKTTPVSARLCVILPE